MDSKNDIIAKFTTYNYGIDYLDRYMCPAAVHNYIFESDDKQKYIWQSKNGCELELINGGIYHIRYLVDRKIYGGRGISIKDVEFVGLLKIVE